MVPNGYVRFPEGTKTKEDKSEASIKHTALQLSRASHFSRPHFLGQPCGVKQAAVWNGAPAPVISVESRASWTTFQSHIPRCDRHAYGGSVSSLRFSMWQLLYFLYSICHMVLLFLPTMAHRHKILPKRNNFTIKKKSIVP